ncbi:MAG: hypothetical protein ACJ74T_00200 [Pyrinomonadaceae bacterium]
MSKLSTEAVLRKEHFGIFLPFPAELIAVIWDKGAILSERLPKSYGPTCVIERWLERELKLASYGKMFSRLLRRRKRDVKYYISPRPASLKRRPGHGVSPSENLNRKVQKIGCGWLLLPTPVRELSKSL